MHAHHLQFFKCGFLRFLFGELRFKKIVTDLNYPSEILSETSHFEFISSLSSLEAKTRSFETILLKMQANIRRFTKPVLSLSSSITHGKHPTGSLHYVLRSSLTLFTEFLFSFRFIYLETQINVRQLLV